MRNATLEPYVSAVESLSSRSWTGTVVRATGTLIESEGPYSSIGESCEIINARGERHSGEIVGFRGNSVLSMPLMPIQGLRFGDTVVSHGLHPSIHVGPELLGRVLDATGAPLDGEPLVTSGGRQPIENASPSAMLRAPIRDPIGCGVRAIDAMLTCGRGQRMGIFGGSGVGKSTLMGMMTRGTSADLTVVALIGERGREVREFLEDALGPEGRRRAIVVVSTSDQSPLLRIRAALTATSIAEYFCNRGQNVLLVLDSITRFAMAQREVGLAAGEPPTSKGYTPSVFSLLARLVERAGNTGSGSITAFYTVLMEGDDQMDPIVDAVRSLLDGHILLDRNLTSAGHFPPINVLESLSRLMPAVCSREHMSKASALRSLLAIYRRSEELIRLGAYVKGSDPDLDRAMLVLPKVLDFLRQDCSELPSLQATIEQFLQLPQ